MQKSRDTICTNLNYYKKWGVFLTGTSYWPLGTIAIRIHHSCFAHGWTTKTHGAETAYRKGRPRR